MRIPIDRENNVPLYRQIEGFLRQEITSGSLSPDTRLPASRRLAADLGVNRLTIETAYAELEADGLIYTRLGSGTYVCSSFLLGRKTHAPGEPQGWPAWQRELLAEGWQTGQQWMDELRCQAPAGTISFAEGGSDPGLFPVADFGRSMQAVLRRDGDAALGYGDPIGYPPLRSTIAHILGSQGVPTHPDHLLITSGSQQALALVVRLLTRPGDCILVEAPTYSGAIDLFRQLDLRLIGVPVDEKGMQVERLPELIAEHRPRLVYTVPNFQNPTGVCMSGPRRRRLLDIAERFDLPILEDDFVGDLRYEGRVLPALKGMDAGGRVIYVNTFSKMLMPGLRVGYLVAEGPVFAALARLKRVQELATSNIIQRTLQMYITVGRYQAHLHRACQVYRQRRNALLAAVRHHLPPGVHLTPPQGGLYAWLCLPEGMDGDLLSQEARRRGVLVAPGSLSYPLRDQRGHLRLNFTTTPPDQIEAGIQRLGAVMRDLM